MSDPTEYNTPNFQGQDGIWYIGGEIRVLSTGKITYDGTEAGPTTALTDSSGGTPGTTIAAVTAPALLTNSTGGTPATTLAAITNSANVGSADVGPTANALAQLAVNAIADRAAIVSLTNAVSSLATQHNVLLTILKNAGLTT